MFLSSLFCQLFNQYSLVKQYDQVDCGPASLLSILKYYKGDSNLVHIRELCETDIQGSNMLGLVNAAKSIGFEAFGARGEYEDLLKERLPCIAHIQLENGLQHFVVVYKMTPRRIFLGDPGRGKYWLNKDVFCKRWKSRSVVLLEPSDSLLNIKTINWIPWLYRYLFHQQSWIIQALFLGITYTLFSLGASVFIQLLIDQFIPSKSTEIIVYTGLFLGFIYLLKSLIAFLRGKIQVVLNKRINIRLTTDFLGHIFSLPKSFFDSRKIGDITARINDSIEIHRAIQLFTQSVFIDGLIVVFSLSFIFYFSTYLGMLAVIFIPIYFAVFVLASRSVKKEQYNVMKNHALMESSYINSIQGINDLISYNQSQFFSKFNITLFKHFQDSIEQLGLLRVRLGFNAESLSAMITVLFLTFGAIKTIHGNILIGQFIAAFSLLSNIIPSINNFVNAYLMMEGAYISIQRMRDLLLIDTETIDCGIQIKNCHVIKFQDVNFGYPKAALLFEHLNLELKKGQITSIWGPSGIGKTTITQLIEKKYRLNAGAILFDHENIETLASQHIRDMIGIVPQHVHLFNGSLFENISVGREALDPGFVQDQIDKLGFQVLIDRFPHGLYTRVGEDGRSLSGGELRLVGILRALCGDPEILIFDEGFSALDIEWQIHMRKLLKDLSENKIVLFITHQLELAAWTDYMYIISKRGVIKEGTPADVFNGELLSNHLVDLESVQNTLS